MIMGAAVLFFSSAMALCSRANSDGENPATVNVIISQQIRRTAEFDRFISRTSGH
jgi:hypothetical protein